MGVRAKGRLLSPLSLMPIVEHLVEQGTLAGLEPALIGEADAYQDLAPETPRIGDAPGAEGPLGGMLALAEYAGARRVFSVACDMPFITAEAIEELGLFCPDAPCVSLKTEDRWEPFFARWDAPALAAAGRALVLRGGSLRLQGLFKELDVAALPRSACVADALRDWDTPTDVLTPRAHKVR